MTAGHGLVAGFLAWLIALLGSVAHDVATINPPPPHCAYEDSAGPCVWDGSTDGNGRGDSFTVDEDGNAWKPFRDIDGHTGCLINVGDTSTVKCADGWTTTS